MAGLKDYETEYVLKDDIDVAVEACKGWFDSCEYCDKRFCKWLTVDEEVYEKIPDKPGFFMIALKIKNATEVVSIIYDHSNIQKNAITTIDSIKGHISDKKSKASKSIILIRWMIIKKEEDKENGVLCAHWCNNGILPKFLKSWPGQKFLEESKTLHFSKKLQKWCYIKKDPVWRKHKPPSSKITEEVKKCNLGSCEICDAYFLPWKLFSEVGENDLQSDSHGLIMFSKVTGKTREVVEIVSDKHRVAVHLASTMKQYESRYLSSKFNKSNARIEVRWMVMKDVDSDNSCFLYAHWLNADRWPESNFSHMPGQQSLNKNKHFVLRNHDKKWLYEIDAFKPMRFSKAKNKRRIRDALADEELDSQSSSD